MRTDIARFRRERSSPVAAPARLRHDSGLIATVPPGIAVMGRGNRPIHLPIPSLRRSSRATFYHLTQNKWNSSNPTTMRCLAVRDAIQMSEARESDGSAMNTAAPFPLTQLHGRCLSFPITSSTTQLRKLATMVSTILFGSSCSQKRRTVHPNDSSARVFRRSRELLASNLSRHHSALFLGCVACTGQPCQKHPSMNTATRDRVKTISPRHRNDASGRKSTR